LIYTTSHIAGIIDAKGKIISDDIIEQLLLDSRKLHAPATSIFFALKGPRRDGHQFVSELYKKGIRNFVISDGDVPSPGADANLLLVDDTLVALQSLARAHRNNFQLPVIGISGSNGKTIVKEWLYQLLQEDFNIVRSPRSYNSQVGVPVSIWHINESHNLGIFEAGISLPGEMSRLEQIIRPTIGVLTNIGEAHSEGFRDREEKLSEKLLLFKNADLLIHSADDPMIMQQVKQQLLPSYCWGRSEAANLRLIDVKKEEDQTVIDLKAGTKQFSIGIPFTDDVAVENAITCCAVLLSMGVDLERVQNRMKLLQPVNMRLELKKAINHCAVINDSYSADIDSLEMALNFLDYQGRGINSKKTVILSDFLQSAMPAATLYQSIANSIEKHGVSRMIGIGENISGHFQQLVINPATTLTVELYPSTADFLKQFRSSQFREEIILVKGARVFGFEEIVKLLEQKVHQTLLEINLNSITHNLKEYQRLLQPKTKVMAMVKAFAYGSGGVEIGSILQYHQVDYLGVAYADEGVELRNSGVTTPVMVMNPETTAFDAIIEHNLEPELYSFGLLQELDGYLIREGISQYPVHIELETGMNRLGFDINQIALLAQALRSPSFKVRSVFSHLAASEDPAQDEFTRLQADRFRVAAADLEHLLGYTVLKHISNSAATIRHPQLEFDMVRLGIGLYGVDSAATNKMNLETVATLRSTIAQIKHLRKGESVSYNRRAVLNRDSIIATVRIGYADGYPRRLGNGRGKMIVAGKSAPVVGTVCMDMTMIDITDIPGVAEGDDVIVFGKALPVQELAAAADTIPYEIMTGISQRVKRVYFEE
jgi:alanine racemase